MIDLSQAKSVLLEVETLVAQLHGAELDEGRAVEDQSKGKARQERARMSQDLNLLADRLMMASTLVRAEYWFARGEIDPLNRARA